MTEAHASPSTARMVWRNRAGALSLASLAAACCVLAVLAAPAGATGAPLRTGVSYVLANEEPAVALEHVKATGAQFAQTPIRWSEVAPEKLPAAWNPEDPADPHYYWEKIDRWVVAAVQDGLTPLLQIRSAPAWAQRCPAAQIDTGAPCNPDPAALAAFATAAARRYSGQFGGLPRVQYWQGLNEPNLGYFFNPQYEGDKPVSPILYRALINAFYAAVKAVDPSDLVLAAGLSPLAVPGSLGPMRFARLLLCMTGGKHPRPTGGNCEGGVDSDIFDIHPYTSGGPTHKAEAANDVEMGDLGKLTTLLAAADRAGRIHGAFPHTPLWITEFSWDSNPPDPGGLAMTIETRWIAEVLHEAWSDGVHTFFWYSLRDAPGVAGFPNAETPQSGLYFRGPTVAQDEPKEAMSAFRFPFVAYPRTKGLEFWGRTPNSGAGSVTIQVLRKGRWRKIVTARANGVGIFRGRAPTAYGRNESGKARALYRSQGSPAFSMRGIPDFFQPPFGTE
ncbi:MAG TPA: hypothetical protein VLK56_02515 [Solirubrobacterales bacterium]|nr:hypothetical protein [Solirubrobacterales bacterium]